MNKKTFKIPIAKLGEYPYGSTGIIQLIDDKALDAIVKNTNSILSKKAKLLTDFDHYSELTEEAKGVLSKLGVSLPTAAAGWINRLYREGDTVYGNMIPTPDGEKAITSESYSMTSPAFRIIDCEYVGKKGSNGEKVIRPLKVKSVALTNKPNMINLGTVMANADFTLKNMDDIQAVLMGAQGIYIFEKEDGIMKNETQDTLEQVEQVEQIQEVQEVQENMDIQNTESVESVEAVEAVEDSKQDTEDKQDTVIENSEVTETVESVESGETSTETVESVESVEAVQEVQDLQNSEVTEPVESVESTESVEEVKEDSEVDLLKARIMELEALLTDKDNEIQALKVKIADMVLMNKIEAELEKYPTLHNREATIELLKKDFEFGVKYLQTLQMDGGVKVIQNRLPTQSPDISLSQMSSHERIKYKMFHKDR